MPNTILYHGTNQRIDVPRWDAGESGRDFGKCFYTTYDENTALDWAKKNYPESYVVNKYSIDFEKLNNGSLKIKRFEANEEWAKFVWSNRYDANFKRPNYDIIVGPIADRGLREKFMKMKTENKTFAEIAPSIQYDKYCSLQVCFCSYYAVSMLNIIE